MNIYATEEAPRKKTARNIAYNIGCVLEWWGDKTVAEIGAKTCRQYAATRTQAAADAHLQTLKSAVKYWHQEYGPLTAMPVFWRPPRPEPRDLWLTRQQAARLLWAARRVQHLRRFILLGLYTGSRSGVILSAEWDQIDLVGKTMSRLKRGAIPDPKKRAPKVRLGDRILAHLRRWKRLDGPHVKVICHYNGQKVDDPHTAWKRATSAAGVPWMVPHALRHTRATWMMQAGVPIWEAAGFLGMSVRTLEKVYGHHAPDHQERAANIR